MSVRAWVVALALAVFAWTAISLVLSAFAAALGL